MIVLGWIALGTLGIVMIALVISLFFDPVDPVDALARHDRKVKR